MYIWLWSGTKLEVDCLLLGLKFNRFRILKTIFSRIRFRTFCLQVGFRVVKKRSGSTTLCSHREPRGDNYGFPVKYCTVLYYSILNSKDHGLSFAKKLFKNKSVKMGNVRKAYSLPLHVKSFKIKLHCTVQYSVYSVYCVWRFCF